MEELVLLGEEHGHYGQVHVASAQDGRWAAAITPGSDEESPSRRYKGNPAVPNEDALAVIPTQRHTAVLVADSHYGAAASHGMVTGLAKAMAEALPTDIPGLRAAVLDCHPDSPPPDRSETTLAVAVLSHAEGRGIGLSFGDSTMTLLTAHSGGGAMHPRELEFVTPWSRQTRSQGHAFTFDLPRGGLFLAFTDGIDECHYRHPETSIRPRHMQALLQARGPLPEPFTRALVDLALRGVDGHAGGQDNVALVACAC